MTQTIDTAFVEVRPDTRGFGRETARQVRTQLAGLDAATATTTRNLKSANASAALMGGTIARSAAIGTAGVAGIGAAAALAGVGVAKVAINFESAFAGVRKTVDATEAEFDRLSGGILDLSTEIPVAANELARIGELAGQLGVENDAILDFTDTIAKLGVTTNLTTETAATAFARFANITQLPQDQFDELGSAIVALGNNFATTEAEISEFALRIAGAGELVGLAESDILGISTALSSLGVEAEAGGTAVQKVLLSMSAAAKGGTKQLTSFAKVTGQTREEFANLVKTDPRGAFQAFVAGLGEIEDSGGSASLALKDLGLADQRLTRAFLAMAGNTKLLDDALDLSAKGFAENTALSKEAGQRFATTASQLTLLKNNIVAVAIEAGDRFLPAIRSGAGELIEFVKGIREGGEGVGFLNEYLDSARATFESIKPLFAGVGADLKNIFTEGAENARKFYTAIKPLAVVVGVTLVVAFRLALKAASLTADMMGVFGDVTAAVVIKIVQAIDGILGGFSALADAASHLPFIGDSFAGVSDAINGARDSLDQFVRDLEGVDGKTVTTNIVVRVGREGEAGQSITGRATPRVGREGTAGSTLVPDTTTTVVPETPTTDDPVEKGLRARREQQLQQAAEIARLTEQTLADDRVALKNLIDFYAESVKLAKARGNSGNTFRIAQLQAESELRALNAGVAADAKAAADEARTAAQERAAAAVEERRSILQANVRIAETTKNTVADDIKAQRALIGFLKQRVDVAKNGSAAQRQALAELRAAQADMRDTLREQRELQLSEREDLLRDNRTLAGFTKTTADDAKALKDLIAYYRKRVANSKRGSAERRKWMIELERSKAELSDLRDSEKVGESAGTTAFELLQGAAQRFGEVAGNLITANNPFAEVSDFLADQSKFLTRGPGGGKASLEVTTKKQRDSSLERLIEALDRNTGAQTGRGEDGKRGGTQSGATGSRDGRWKESRNNRAMVEGAI